MAPTAPRAQLAPAAVLSTPSQRTSLPASSGVSPELAPSLAASIHALDEARARLRAGRPQEALSVLEAHREELARSPLGPQAEVVRIEALLALGDRAGASTRARAFLASHPSGVLADRVRQLVPEGG